ncbi:hypothetical protein RchiOBHm_Chr5g0020351 [Rosa chinensis]|uniref:Late embryogenesis abundant protein, LEA-14 n=1 Tax=Rosa chinensis TaxID=74649 RepID=A0A2P6Q7A4_ROSCH|nr:NDR1/HIN1-like protein 3 [Rosa chinensis]PRQ30044.1 hypothetical protein RchiOBHm_Chr5g0020351 [Rosa chinensis]
MADCVSLTGFIISVIVLLCYLLITPSKPSIHVTDASLTPPNNNTTTHHHYNLALNITLRNPNMSFKTYNKKTKLVAYCKNNQKRIGTAELYPFGQRTRKTTTFTALSFKGEEGEDDLKACEEGDNGDYDDVVIKLYLTNIYYLIGPNVKGSCWEVETEFVCNLKVPLITGAYVNGSQSTMANTTGGSPKSFTATKCKSNFSLYH